MRKLAGVAVAVVVLMMTACAPVDAEPAPTVTVTVTAPAEPAPTVTVTVTPEAVAPPVVDEPDAGAAPDLTTDAGLCAADAELTNLELNDAIAPLLGYPADRDLRTSDQDDAIRAYKNEAFLRECPARAG